MALFTRVTNMHFTNGSPMHRVLSYIAHNRGTCLQDIADDMCAPRESIQEYTRYAANEGWVRRWPRNGHCIPMEITAKGRAALSDIQGTYSPSFNIVSYVHIHPGCTANEAIRNTKAGTVKPSARHFKSLVANDLLEVKDGGLHVTKAGLAVLCFGMLGCKPANHLGTI